MLSSRRKGLEIASPVHLAVKRYLLNRARKGITPKMQYEYKKCERQTKNLELYLRTKSEKQQDGDGHSLRCHCDIVENSSKVGTAGIGAFIHTDVD